MSVHCFKRPCRCWFWKPGLRSPACGEPAVTERPQTARKGRGGRAGRLGSTLPFLSANPGLQLQCREPWPRLGLGPGRTTVLLSTRPSVAVARTQGPRHCQMLPQSLGYEKQLKEGLLVVSVGGGRRCLVPRESLSRVRRSCLGPLVFVYPVVTCGCLSASVPGRQILRFW